MVRLTAGGCIPSFRGSRRILIARPSCRCVLGPGVDAKRMNRHHSRMPTGEVRLTDAAMRLPRKKRARLASVLLDSLASAKEREIADAWANEAQARSKAYKQGRLKTVSVEDAFGFKA